MATEVDAHPVLETPNHKVRHGFVVGDCRLLVPRKLYSELAPLSRVCRIPDTPAWFRGFTNHRGETVPVYDLGPALGLDAKREAARWILLLDTHPYRVALLLAHSPRAIVDPVEVDPGRVESPLRSYATAAWEHDGQVWAEFDHRRCFTELISRF